jgi:hypothetical protein
MLDPEECRLRADDCIERAKSTRDPRLKSLYRSIAQCWLGFADEKVRHSSLLARSVDLGPQSAGPFCLSGGRPGPRATEPRAGAAQANMQAHSIP